MHGDADSPKASASALLPAALVAAMVLGVALFVKGGETGAIVVERLSLSAISAEGNRTQHSRATSLVQVTETGANGAERRSFVEDSASRPGFQQLTTGSTIELYDPLDNTIFQTTMAAWRRVVDAQMGIPATGRGAAQVSERWISIRSDFAAGRESIPEQQLQAHEYRLGGPTTRAGRPALKLVQAPRRLLAGSPDTSQSTYYVAPRSYDPIEEVVTTKFGGVTSTEINRWSSYRVLPIDPATRRLVSLTARHPHARVVDSASGYVRASQSEIRTAPAR